MTMPFYVAPEQVMKDRADYARKGIARGRSVVVAQYDAGIVFVAENPSRALHKVSEIYDRIAFAAVGRYNEFENLRIAGVRLADLRGYSYDRRDVTGRALANAYAQTLGAIFSGGEKPYEVEVVVAEVGDTAEQDQVYRLTYDGSVGEERGYAVMGGPADAVDAEMARRHTEGAGLAQTLRAAVDALARGGAPERDSDRQLGAESLEVAVLDRTRTQQRKFRAIPTAQVRALLTGGADPGGADPGNAAAEAAVGSAEPGSAAADPAGAGETPGPGAPPLG